MNAKGQIVNDDGTPSAVVHQWDRFAPLRELMDRMYPRPAANPGGGAEDADAEDHCAPTPAGGSDRTGAGAGDGKAVVAVTVDGRPNLLSFAAADDVDALAAAFAAELGVAAEAPRIAREMRRVRAA